MQIFYFVFLFLVFALTACQRPSAAYFQEQGYQKIEELITELQKIESIDELLAHEIQLKTLYEELVDLIIQAKVYQKKHKVYWKTEAMHQGVNEELRRELNRLYKLPGGKEIMEKYQLQACQRLDAFEKKQAIT